MNVAVNRSHRVRLNHSEASVGTTNSTVNTVAAGNRNQ